MHRGARYMDSSEEEEEKEASFSRDNDETRDTEVNKSGI